MSLAFGTQDDLNCIVDIPLRSSVNEELCLGFKVSMHFFGAGIYTSDEGYVLKVKGTKSYYPMPTGDELGDYQAHGMIPSPLPSYSVPLFDYLFGYSLWIVFGVIGAVAAIKHAVRKKPPAA